MSNCRYMCSIHSALGAPVWLVLATLDGGGSYWRCPVDGCQYMKPAKHGRRNYKRRSAGQASGPRRINAPKGRTSR